MAHYSKWLIGLMGLSLLTACSDDVVKPGTDTNPIRDDEGEGVYMSVNIKMPTGGGTRSYTDSINSSNSGTEIGQDYENNVNTVYLVLAETEDNGFITWGEIPASGIVKNSDGTQYISTAKFSKSELAQHYEKHPVEVGKNRDVNVFVFCNPTLTLRNLLDGLSVGDSWTDATGKLDTTSPTAEIIWSENNFLMSNSEIAVRTIPRTIDEWIPYSTEAKAFNLSGLNDGTPYDNSMNATVGPRGPVKVERTAARFDFKDGSPNGDNLYHVVYSDEEIDGKKPCYIDIKLHKMSLTNMNKEYYFLRRVSPNGLETDAELCGPELPWFTNENGTLNTTLTGNYVVNPLASQMEDPILSAFSQYFNYPFFNSEGEIDNVTLTNWFTSVIDDVLKGPNDNYVYPEGVQEPEFNKDYHIWRYVTENTIPGIDMQKNGQSTGIVFKGQMIATKEALEAVDKDGNPDENIRELAKIINNVLDTVTNRRPLTGNPAEDPIIYKFNGVKNNVGGMYATWPNVEQAAKAEAITPVWEADNTDAGGFWRLEINRSAPLFHAVFGEGSCGSYTFTTSSGDTVRVADPVTKVDESTPSYAWHKWNEAGRPVPQSDAQAQDGAYTLYYNFKTAAVAAKFTLYQTSYDGTNEYGYYCYYYYWNRHNNNGKNGIMAPMEFATVRNNVYKLAVTSISSIGHPRLTENDPDKPTPDTDDEIDDIYITVEVEVLPWVVRVNNIEF